MSPYLNRRLRSLAEACKDINDERAYWDRVRKEASEFHTVNDSRYATDVQGCPKLWKED